MMNWKESLSSYIYGFVTGFIIIGHPLLNIYAIEGVQGLQLAVEILIRLTVQVILLGLAFLLYLYISHKVHNFLD